MWKAVLPVFLAAATALGQYTMNPAGAPPSELAPAIAAELQNEGVKIVSGDGKVYAEIWFRSKAPSGPELEEIDLTWTTAPHGALVGVIRFPGEGQDRCGLAIKPGVYTLRFSFFPIDGAHQGAEPSRDFLILSPAAIDKDPAATPGFDELMEMSRQASGTRHPACLSMWKPDGDFQPGLSQLGEHDWVLSVKIGDTPISIIVVGVSENA